MYEWDLDEAQDHTEGHSTARLKIGLQGSQAVLSL